MCSHIIFFQKEGFSFLSPFLNDKLTCVIDLNDSFGTVKLIQTLLLF